MRGGGLRAARDLLERQSGRESAGGHAALFPSAGNYESLPAACFPKTGHPRERERADRAHRQTRAAPDLSDSSSNGRAADS